MNAQLTFNQVSFDAINIKQDQQIWVNASDLAKALGYKKADAVTQIYNRNADEFSPSMSQTLKLSVSGNINDLQHKSVRIFSLRGCHLVAMLAKTAVAKAFRKWVLDLIESEVNKHHILTTADERTGLRQAVDALVGKHGLLYPDAYKMIHQRFNVNSIDELTVEQIAEAVEYIHRLTLGHQDDKQREDINLKAVLTLADWCSHWYFKYSEALRIINPRMIAAVHDCFQDMRFSLADVGKRYGVPIRSRDSMKNFPWDGTAQERMYFGVKYPA